MAALRCSHCDFDLPTRTQFKTCPLCNRPTWMHDGSPESDWQGRIDSATKDESKIELAFLYPHPVDAEVRVRTPKHGGSWIRHQDLIDAGYRHLEDFSVVYVNGTFLELQDHSLASFRIIGEHTAAGVWRVEPVRFDLEADTFPEEWVSPPSQAGPAAPGAP